MDRAVVVRQCRLVGSGMTTKKELVESRKRRLRMMKLKKPLEKTGSNILGWRSTGSS